MPSPSPAVPGTDSTTLADVLRQADDRTLDAVLAVALFGAVAFESAHRDGPPARRAARSRAEAAEGIRLHRRIIYALDLLPDRERRVYYRRVPMTADDYAAAAHRKRDRFSQFASGAERVIEAMGPPYVGDKEEPYDVFSFAVRHDPTLTDYKWKAIVRRYTIEGGGAWSDLNPSETTGKTFARAVAEAAVLALSSSGALSPEARDLLTGPTPARP